MSSHSILQTWLIDGLETATNGAYNKKRSKLLDAADTGNWNQVFSILQEAQKSYHESWVNCTNAANGWTALHYAAYEGTPISTINKLLQMGAWRT